jgi:asparagine synthase (glutamine-hydrolysing)
MCGISGFLTNCLNSTDHFNKQGEKYADAMTKIATGMADAISKRGPDSAGAWVDTEGGVALGHRRLSIVDLSVAGHQPMHSFGHRFVISFNGEIYNHESLRSELDSINSFTMKNRWHGHSDTETLLAGFEVWGIEATLKKTVGMFALALWDKHTRTLHLARDRFGEKPLYYGWVGEGQQTTFVFGSELKALRAYPGFENPVSREALALFMRFTYVPAPYSIYKKIYKLEPGCLLSTTGGFTAAPNEPLRPPSQLGGVILQRWWSLGDVVERGAAAPLTDEKAAVDALEKSLQQSVSLQSLADVPLGAFLSGGVDSSTIVALMQKQSMRPIKTFTVGFEEVGFDESPHARAVAHHLGTEHHEMFVSATEAQTVIPNLPDMYDEPFADSSQIPTHLICKAARQSVTVALSGDAGDELFGGYNRYFWGPRIWNRLAWMPYPTRQLLGAAIQSVPVSGWDALIRPINVFLPGNFGVNRAGDKAHKLAHRLIGVSNLDELYRSLVSEWQDPAAVVLAGDRGGKHFFIHEPASLLDDELPSHGVDSHQLRMMFRDSITYLPDDILCKVDRAAMASSLETRVPFLDHRVAELAWQLPLSMKIRRGEGKWALRQVLYKYVPRKLIERPKAGFGIPLGQWLRGPLREWAEALLDEKRLGAEGYFYPKPIRSKWAEHLSGKRDHTASLWTVLIFQAWLEKAR